jgi:hypothetical protein
MRTHIFLLVAAVCGLVMPAHAQARPGCPERPRTLGAMRDCYRPLLVFAPSASDPRLRQQQAVLEAAADDMMDRDVLFVPVLASAKAFNAPLDAPYALLPKAEVDEIRKRFHVRPGEFAVVLLGEDGGAKLRAGEPVLIERLNGLIDAMPMRQREMQQPNTN